MEEGEVSWSLKKVKKYAQVSAHLDKKKSWSTTPCVWIEDRKFSNIAGRQPVADLGEGPGAAPPPFSSRSGSATDNYETKFLHVIEHLRWHLIILNQVLIYYLVI